MSDFRLKYLSGGAKVNFRILEKRFKELSTANEQCIESLRPNLNDLRDDIIEELNHELDYNYMTWSFIEEGEFIFIRSSKPHSYSKSNGSPIYYEIVSFESIITFNLNGHSISKNLAHKITTYFKLLSEVE